MNRVQIPMLTIRQTQIAFFSKLETEKFEDWMVNHLTKFFPQQVRALGESRLRETIQHGINRAAAYDVTIKRDVCKYIDLMIVFGRDFDTDQRFRWAAEILRKKRNPTAKMRALIETAKARLGKR